MRPFTTVIFATLAMASSCRTAPEDTRASIQEASAPDAESMAVDDWRTVPNQGEIDKLMKGDFSDPAYANYRDYSTCDVSPVLCREETGRMPLPGNAIVDAMRDNQKLFGIDDSNPFSYVEDCLQSPEILHSWNDIQAHYICTFSTESKVRLCFTAALSSAWSGSKNRLRAFEVCSGHGSDRDIDEIESHVQGFSEMVEKFKANVVQRKQSEIFQFIMFASTWAFERAQEQTTINTFYGIVNPNNPDDCGRRPLRQEDLSNKKHCLANKSYRSGSDAVAPAGF
jgi:hypothetical protein